MTKKEKKELALKLAAEIEAKKPKQEKEGGLSKEHMTANNHRRAMLSKARSGKGDFLSGSKYKNKKPLQDYDPW